MSEPSPSEQAPSEPAISEPAPSDDPIPSNPTEEFFNALVRRGHEPLLEKVVGTIRFDLTSGEIIEHLFLKISHGDLSVSRNLRVEGDRDLVVRADRNLFDKFATGEKNILAAWLRNEVIYDGSPRLARFFARLFPEPPGAHHPRHYRENTAG